MVHRSSAFRAFDPQSVVSIIVCRSEQSIYGILLDAAALAHHKISATDMSKARLEEEYFETDPSGITELHLGTICRKWQRVHYVFYQVLGWIGRLDWVYPISCEHLIVRLFFKPTSA